MKDETDDYFPIALEKYREHLLLYGRAKTHSEARDIVSKLGREELKEAMLKAVIWRFHGGNWITFNEACPTCQDIADHL